MRRLFLLFGLISGVVQASSSTFVSCTLGSITQTQTDPTASNCVLPYVVNGTFLGSVEGHASVQNLTGPMAPGYYAVYTEAVVVPFYEGSQWVYAEAKETILFYTAGPRRSGLVQFDMFMGYSHGNLEKAWVDLTDGVHTYSPGYDSIGGGDYAATAPFDLGVPFQITLRANSSWAPGGASENADVSFTLFESDGTTPVAYSEIPEPASWGLMVLAFLLAHSFGFTRLKRRHSGFSA